jgi:hypothetical protein
MRFLALSRVRIRYSLGRSQLWGRARREHDRGCHD